MREGQHAAGPTRDGLVDHLSVNKPDALLILGKHRPRVLNLFRAGRERGVDHRDLLRMHGSFAGEAQAENASAFLLKLLRVREVEEGCVDHIDPGRGRCHDQMGAGVKQALPAVRGTEVGREVGGAELEGGQPRSAPGDLIQPGEGLGRLDQGDEACAGEGTLQQRVQLLQIGGSLDFGHQDEVRLRLRL